MLPETKDGKDLFNRIRENRNRYRQYCMSRNGGDIAAIRLEELGQLALEADLAGFREVYQFMRSEDMLSPEQIEAADNCLGWAKALLALLPEECK